MWLVAVLVCLGWVVSLCFHEFGHAIVAYWGGDTSVKEKGYLTFNPLKYTDPGLSLVLPLVFLLVGGIALPGGAVYINHNLLRDRKWESAVSAAGPIANILVVFMLAVPFQLGWHLIELDRDTFLTGTFIFYSLAFLILINIYVIFINLLPIPSLDGYGIIKPWLPRPVQRQFEKVGQYGIWILIGLLWFVQPFNQFLWSLTARVSQFLRVPIDSAVEGGAIFREHSLILVVGLLAVLWVFGSKEKQWYVKGNNWVGVKRYPRALTCYEKALEVKPDYVEAWQGKGYVLMQLQRYEEAIACYDKAVELQPEQSHAWFVRGVILTDLQRYEEALTSFDRAISLQSENGEIWLYQGQTLLGLQRYEDAIASFDCAISFQPKRNTEAYAQYYRSYALSQLARHEEAILACDRALELQPSTAVFWLLRGDLLAALNRNKESLESYEQAIHFQPNLSEAKRKREHLLKKLDR